MFTFLTVDVFSRCPFGKFFNHYSLRKNNKSERGRKRDINVVSADDGRVTKDEWVLHWCCVYGDTAAYARFVWEELSQGADYVDASMFLGPPFGKQGNDAA